MTTYREFQGELERLHAEQERARRKEKAETIARIRSLMAEYGMTPDELGQRLARIASTSQATHEDR